MGTTSVGSRTRGRRRSRRTPEAHEGVLYGGVPVLTLGSGPPLLVLTGLSPEHRAPRGFDRWVQARMIRPLVDHFTVHVASRRVGLAPGTTMQDLADHVAAVIEHDLGAPLPVMGVSTGGSIALQLAVDHPDLVERLVVASSACRLGPVGKQAQRQLADLSEAGRHRDAWAALAPTMSSTTVARSLMRALMWLTGPMIGPDDPGDMAATIRAEDAFDVTDHLHRIQAPTLVVGGGRDGFYDTALFEATARGIPQARLLLYPGKSHTGVLTHAPAQQQILRFLTAAHDEPLVPAGEGASGGGGA